MQRCYRICGELVVPNCIEKDNVSDVVILAVSLTLNAVFLSLFIYGTLIDRRMKKEAKKILDNVEKETNEYMNQIYRYHA